MEPSPADCCVLRSGAHASSNYLPNDQIAKRTPLTKNKGRQASWRRPNARELASTRSCLAGGRKEGAGPTGWRPNHLLVQDAKLYAVRDHATHHAIRPSAGKQLLILPLWCHGWQSHAHWQLQRGDLPEASLAKELLDALADVLVWSRKGYLTVRNGEATDKRTKTQTS